MRSLEAGGLARRPASQVARSQQLTLPMSDGCGGSLAKNQPNAALIPAMSQSERIGVRSGSGFDQP